jgi:hypothetical protein
LVIVVQQSEGLIAYVEARAFINSKWSVHRSVFLAFLDMNPVRALTREAPSWLPRRDNAQAWLFQVSVLTSSDSPVFADGGLTALEISTTSLPSIM